MAAQIYSTPKEVKRPEIDFSNFNYKKYEEECNQYTENIKTFLKERGYTGKNVGEVIRFQIADGYAQYMVMSMRPLKLIHLDIDDAYQYPNVDLMTAKRVQQMIDADKKMQKLFGK